MKLGIGVRDRAKCGAKGDTRLICSGLEMLRGIFIAGIFIVFSAFFALSAIAADSLTIDQQVELENLLEQDCGSCHGLLLNGGLGPSLIPEDLKGKSVEYLTMVIRDGRPNTAMPPWKPLLSETEIEWLANRLLQPPAKGSQRVEEMSLIKQEEE